MYMLSSFPFYKGIHQSGSYQRTSKAHSKSRRREGNNIVKSLCPLVSQAIGFQILSVTLIGSMSSDPGKRSVTEHICDKISFQIWRQMILLCHRILEHPDLPSTCFWIRCGFIFSALESGLKIFGFTAEFARCMWTKAISGK